MAWSVMLSVHLGNGIYVNNKHTSKTETNTLFYLIPYSLFSEVSSPHQPLFVANSCNYLQVEKHIEVNTSIALLSKPLSYMKKIHYKSNSRTSCQCSKVYKQVIYCCAFALKLKRTFLFCNYHRCMQQHSPVQKNARNSWSQ